MKIKIVCVGKIKEKFFTQAVEEYLKRLSRFCKVEIVEKEECLCKQPNPNEKQIAAVLEQEGQNLLPHLEGFCVALDKDGSALTSHKFAEVLQSYFLTNNCVTFVIGGSFGLCESIKNAADLNLSFGAITLPHQLARVVCAEQIYRAFMINAKSNYHK